MRQDRNILRWLADHTDLDGEPIPGETLVELAGDRRILIENHSGVREYGRGRIVVNVKYGTIQICGNGLELNRMSREQLVIWGRIDSISVFRREC